MNLFFVFGSGADARLMTPSLSGSLLPGVTRDSLLQLATDLGYQVDEGSINVDDWRKACESGELTEVFACGTAAVITPVGTVKGRQGHWTIGGENRADHDAASRAPAWTANRRNRRPAWLGPTCRLAVAAPEPFPQSPLRVGVTQHHLVQVTPTRRGFAAQRHPVRH